MKVRSGEQEKSWFRGERYAMVNDQWFFTSRGFAIEGPFKSKQEAESELIKSFGANETQEG